MIEINHDYPDTTPVAVEIPCGPVPESYSALQSLVGQAAMYAEAGDVASVDKAVGDIQALIHSGVEAPAEPTVRPLTDDELAQRDADTREAKALAAGATARALGQLLGKRDRYLAETDVFMLPASALPVDMPQSVKEAITANQQAWAAWRQQLREYPATVKDPLDPPPFPTAPAAPKVLLT